MKILFCDIDGVIITSTSIQKYKKMGCVGSGRILDPEKIGMLNSIVKETSCKIVIIGSWKGVYTLEQLRLIFNHAGLYNSNSTIIDKIDSGDRQEKIIQWLCNNQQSSILILDDELTHLGSLKDFAIKTEFDKGLTQDIVDKSIAHLNYE